MKKKYINGDKEGKEKKYEQKTRQYRETIRSSKVVSYHFEKY